MFPGKLEQYRLIIILILAGAFLRTYNLGAESLWLDEAISLSVAQSDIGSIANPPPWEVHVMPLYYFLLHSWIGIVGNGEFWLRFLSVIFGVLCIPVTYLLGRSLFDSHEVGLWGALILTFSMFHVRYSQEARMYSLLALVTLVSMYFFLRVLKENRMVLWFCYGLSSVLLVYTHIYGWFILVTQVMLFALWSPGMEDSGGSEGRTHLWKGMASFSLALLAFLPWMMKIFGSMSDGIGPESLSWLPSPNLIFLVGTFFVFASGSLLGFALLFWLGKDGVLAAIDTRGRRIRNLLSFNKRSFGTLVCIFWLLVPVIGAYSISKTLTPILHPRYLIFCSPALFLLAAKGIPDKKRSIRLILALIIIIDGVSCIAAHYVFKENERWRDAAEYLEVHGEPEEVIYVTPYWFTPPLKHYYRGMGKVKGIDDPCNHEIVMEGGTWLVMWDPLIGGSNGRDAPGEVCQFEYVEDFPSLDILYTLNLMGIPLYNVVSPNIILYHSWRVN